MSRIEEVTFEFVDLLPPTLAEGVVYISLEHRTVVHLCCSGCGERVVIGLGPAQWSFIFDGETISFRPSIGNGSLPCNSHYWITKNRVEWSKPLTSAHTRASQNSDRKAVLAHYKKQEQISSVAWWNLPRRMRRRDDR